LISSYPRLVGLLNNRWLLIGSLLLFALVLNREGDHMPTGNEFIYLLYFFKAWHPKFLATDWTFQETTAGHAIFNYATGWLTLLMPLKAAAWVGRVCSWAATFIGLFRLGRHFRIPPWAIGAGILLWLLQRQSPVTGEWMIGTFEAKVIAYIFLLFGIDAAIRGKNLLAGILCGLAFSFHTAVGMWGGAAVGVAVLLNNRIRQTIIFSIAAIVLALPGLVTSLPLVMSDHAISAAGAKFLVTVALPSCLDARSFPHTWLLVLPVMALFSAVHSRWLSGDRSARMLCCFECTAALCFLFGLFARFTDRFGLALLYPMRVFAVFALLLFFWQFTRLLQEVWIGNSIGKNKLAAPLLCCGCLLFLAIPSPLLGMRDLAATHVERLKEVSTGQTTPARNDDASFKDAALWIAGHTPTGDLVIAPPWRAECFYFARRPLIANWHAPRYDQMDQWQVRIEDLVGDVSKDNDNPEDMGTRPRARYAQLTTRQVVDLMKKYTNDGQGCWFISTSPYPFLEVYKTGSYSVYHLR